MSIIEIGCSFLPAIWVVSVMGLSKLYSIHELLEDKLKK